MVHNPPKKLLLASNNPGKLHEVQRLLSAYNYQIIPQTDLNIPEVPETGFTFVENAIIKARNACEHADLPVIADDTGLVIDALNGEPGIYSARYAGEGADSNDNIQKVLQQMQAIAPEKRTACFRCVIVYLRHAKDPAPVVCYGSWEGRILLKEQGENGFGYDPIFYVPTHDCSAAELPIEIKNKIGHRGLALQQLLNSLQSHDKP